MAGERSTRTRYTIPDTEQWNLTSRKGNREYRIFVYQPREAAPPCGYPVLYLLDANSTFGSVVEAVRLQTRKPHGYDPVIVVGIGYPTDEPFDVSGRFLDYTVPASAEELLPRKDGSPWPKVGGADGFLDFIEEELKPIVQRQFTVDITRQALFGHSLGGLFALHVLFTKPSAFQAYVAGSPSIWWKNGYLFGLEKLFKERLESHALAEKQRKMPASDAARPTAQTTDPRTVGSTEASEGDILRLPDPDGKADEAAVRLLIAVGGREKPHMIEDAAQMYGRLTSGSLPGFHAEYECFVQEGHVSVIPPLISRALKFILL